MTGAGPHFIAVAVLAMMTGGLALLASLIVVSSLVQFALAEWLPLLRRVITPVVSGTALMLIAVTVMSVAIARLGEVPEGAGARRRAGCCGGDAGSCRNAGHAGNRHMAVVGPADWDCLWNSRCRPLRTVRSAADNRGALALRAGHCGLAGLRLYAGRRVLDSPSGVSNSEPRGRHQDEQRRRCDSAGLAGQPPGDRLSSGPGRRQHQRPGYVPGRDCRDVAHDRLHAVRCDAHHPHGRRGTQRGVCNRGHLARTCVPAQGGGSPADDSQSGNGRIPFDDHGAFSSWKV